MIGNPTRARRSGNDICAACMALAALAAFAPQTRAQGYIGQDGRLLDANTQIGGNRQNAVRPVSPLLSGNAMATGNMGRGFSLRSSSPIASPYAFGASLGSGALSAFRRDSVGVSDSGFSYGAMSPRLFYDPNTTVVTPGFFSPQRTAPPDFLSGGFKLNSGSMPIRSQLPSAQQVTQLPGAAARPQQPLDLRIDSRIESGSSLLSPIGDGALNSAIFGAFVPSWKPSQPSSLFPMADLQRPDPADLADLRDESVRPLGEALGRPLGTPLDLILRGADANTMLDRGVRSALGGTPQLPGLQAESQREASLLQEARMAVMSQFPISTPLAMPRVLGLDKFTDMQLAMSLSHDPNAAWFAEMKRVVADNPQVAMEMQRIVAMDSAQFAESIIDTPIQTFVGRGDSALNESLMRAEALLQSRDYFDAASQYDRARLFDPGNPLPLIGKGHASLGAGDYQSAVYNILLGLQRYPELTRMKVDLVAFMGGESIDIRRADLIRRLERSEDAKLRFLLGYLEYYSGRTESGLAHLKKAAANVPAGSFIFQFPALITGEWVLPPPKLPLGPMLNPIGTARAVEKQPILPPAAAKKKEGP